MSTVTAAKSLVEWVYIWSNIFFGIWEVMNNFIENNFYRVMGKKRIQWIEIEGYLFRKVWPRGVSNSEYELEGETRLRKKCLGGVGKVFWLNERSTKKKISTGDRERKKVDGTLEKTELLVGVRSTGEGVSHEKTDSSFSG